MPKAPKANRPVPAVVLDYLEDRLNDDERYAVEQTWLRDPDTRAAVEGFRQSGLSARELKEDFAKIRQSWHGRDARRSENSTRRLSWVAILLFVLLAAWSAWGYYQDQRPSPLYAEYFTKSVDQENYLAVRGVGTEEIAGVNAALATYEQGDYANSYRQFQALRENHSFNSTVLRYTALSALRLGELYAAEQALQQSLSITATPQEHAAATWYLALTYLELGEKRRTVQLLNDLIATKSGQYYEHAHALRAEL